MLAGLASPGAMGARIIIGETDAGGDVRSAAGRLSLALSLMHSTPAWISALCDVPCRRPRATLTRLQKGGQDGRQGELRHGAAAALGLLLGWLRAPGRAGVAPGGPSCFWQRARSRGSAIKCRICLAADPHHSSSAHRRCVHAASSRGLQGLQRVGQDPPGAGVLHVQGVSGGHGLPLPR